MEGVILFYFYFYFQVTHKVTYLVISVHSGVLNHEGKMIAKKKEKKKIMGDFSTYIQLSIYYTLSLWPPFFLVSLLLIHIELSTCSPFFFTFIFFFFFLTRFEPLAVPCLFTSSDLINFIYPYLLFSQIRRGLFYLFKKKNFFPLNYLRKRRREDFLFK